MWAQGSSRRRTSRQLPIVENQFLLSPASLAHTRTQDTVAAVAAVRGPFFLPAFILRQWARFHFPFPFLFWAATNASRSSSGSNKLKEGGVLAGLILRFHVHSARFHSVLVRMLIRSSGTQDHANCLRKDCNGNPCFLARLFSSKELQDRTSGTPRTSASFGLLKDIFRARTTQRCSVSFLMRYLRQLSVALSSAPRNCATTHVPRCLREDGDDLSSRRHRTAPRTPPPQHKQSQVGSF